MGSTAWLTEAAAGAEAAGAGALWAIDHLFWGAPTLECMVAATVAATATRRAAVGTCVLQLPLRSPAAVAKQATTLQLLSGGRFVLGVGSGSHPGEYEAAGAGASYPTRGAALDRGIAALRAAWRTAGEPDRRYRQEPPSDPVPVWVGGSSPAARRRAAATGDGWVPLFLPPDELGPSVDLLHRETAAAGRDPSDVTAAVVVMLAVGDGPGTHAAGTRWLSSLYGIPPKAFDRHLIAGPPERCAEEVARFAAAGAEHVVVMVADDDVAGHFARLAEALGLAGPVGAANGVRAMEPERQSHRLRRERTEVPA